MSDLDYVKIILGLVVLAGVLSVWFWIWAWIAGPAVRHLGKCWAQGLAQGLANPEKATGPWTVMRGVGLLPPQASPDRTDAPAPPKSPAPEPTKRAPVGPPRYLVPTEKE